MRETTTGHWHKVLSATGLLYGAVNDKPAHRANEPFAGAVVAHGGERVLLAPGCFGTGEVSGFMAGTARANGSFARVGQGPRQHSTARASLQIYAHW